ncbi:MAG: S41 family peptidase [Candidatus Sericytochromatia bacterium]
MSRSLWKRVLWMCVAFGMGLSTAPAFSADLARQLAVLTQALELIQRHGLNAPDELSLVRAATQGLIEALDDPYSDYLTPAEYEALTSEKSGQVVGIGIEIAWRNEQVLIMSVFDGTPAERAGLRAGERILAINGETLEGLSWARINQLLQGERGEAISLTRQLPGIAQPVERRLVREILNLQAVTTQRLPGNTCQLRIRTFLNENLHTQVMQLLQQEASFCNEGWVIDLRNNPGGLLSEAVQVAGQLGIEGAVVEVVGREGRSEILKSSQSDVIPQAIPLVVLINGGTASAAEVLAAALQESGRALVMGQTSFGKGLVQSLLPLEDGSGLSLTTNRYLTGRGHSLHQRGIQPDVMLPEGDPDRELTQAADYLRTPPALGEP